MTAIKNITVLFVCGVVFLFCNNVYAEKSIGTLLEEATYQEETVGDVNKAITIYQQVIADDEARRPEAARATYRAGMCFLKKGDKDKATQLFNDVVTKFADQKVFITKARKELQKLGGGSQSTVPTVIETVPANFASDVDPGLSKLSVTFDRPMTDKSWAWVTWNWPFPETTGKPSYDSTVTTCSLPVKLEAGKAYLCRINSPPKFVGFYSANGAAAQPYVLVFATKSTDGKPTPIPADMLAFAKEINAAQPEAKIIQEGHSTIDANGLIHFKSPNKRTNDSSEPMTTDGFINSDFVSLTKMYEENGTAIPFETTHEGNIYRYNIKFNKPIMPGKTMVYYTEGTIKGLVKPVAGKTDVYRYYMVHSPAAGQPVRRIQTYLLPQGAELLSRTPETIKVSEEAGRIKLSHEEIVPAGGNILTEFQYKLGGAKLASAEPLKLESGPMDEIGMRMKLTTPAGADIGQIIWHPKPIDINGAPGWRIESFMNVSVANMQQYTFVDVLKKTYAPVSSQTKNTMMGNFMAQYQTGKVILTCKGDSNETAKTINVSDPVFDNEQALYVIRKMPLKEGYSGTFNIFPVEGGTEVECKIEVLKGIEAIKINSGPIACYKIKLNVLSQGTSVLEHTLWISTDSNRYLVKYDSGEAIMEMVQPIMRWNPVTSGEAGLAHGRIAIPSEWVCLWSPKDGIQESMQIMAPGLPFWAVEVKQPADPDCNSANEIAHKDSEKLIGFFKNYKPVAQSWKDVTINLNSGKKLPITSYYATYEDKGKQMVEYRAYMLNKPEVFWFVFRIEKDQFEKYKPQFDSIINSFHDADR